MVSVFLQVFVTHPLCQNYEECLEDLQQLVPNGDSHAFFNLTTTLSPLNLTGESDRCIKLSL